MKENKIEIKICRSIEDVFDFTTNPENTRFWLPSVEKEVAEQYPPVLGTEYRNKGYGSDWNVYFVAEIERPRVFSLTNRDGNYVCRYTYEDMNTQITRMKYYERMKRGELEAPFTIDILENLKRIMEARAV